MTLTLASKLLHFSARLTAFLLLSSIANASYDISNKKGTDKIVSAIQRYICFSSYWLSNKDYQNGVNSSVVIHEDDNIAYIWAEGLQGSQPTKKFGNFFIVVTGKNESGVVTAASTNLDFDLPAIFKEYKKKVFSGNVMIEDLYIPEDCSPRFDKTSPLKKHMLENIKKTIEINLAAANIYAPGSYPKKLKVIISDLNIDYPYAFVFVPYTQEIFSIRLHNANDLKTDHYLRDVQKGEYVMQLVSNKTWAESLKIKIPKYGIAKYISFEIKP